MTTVPERNIPFAPKEGEIITFGRYPQNSGIPEPIEWRVLSVESDRVLLISLYALDCVLYNEQYEDVIWSACTLRSWLNGEFIDAAFSPDEQRRIHMVTLSNPENPLFSTPGGADTVDRIFCLSTDEAERYFSSNDDRICKATEWAENKEIWINDAGGCWWWLRSPGKPEYSAVSVYGDGDINLWGDGVSIDRICVRPALYMKL